MKNNINYLKTEMEFQDKNAERYSLIREMDYIWEVPEQLLLIKKEYFIKGLTVIDMGCGPSTPIKNILKEKIIKDLEYIGVDISENMLKCAKRNIPSGKFLRGDISTIDFKFNYADRIISLGALHHCENKIETINHWLNILKKGGLILLREPTYEVLKKGKGESPIEEGIKVEEFMKYIKSKKLKVVSFYYFSSPAFHLFNRLMIKLRLGKWQKIKTFWYPIVVLDVLFGKLFSNMSFFRGGAFTLTIQKL